MSDDYKTAINVKQTVRWACYYVHNTVVRLRWRSYLKAYRLAINVMYKTYWVGITLPRVCHFNTILVFFFHQHRDHTKTQYSIFIFNKFSSVLEIRDFAEFQRTPMKHETPYIIRVCTILLSRISLYALDV